MPLSPSPEAAPVAIPATVKRDRKEGGGWASVAARERPPLGVRPVRSGWPDDTDAAPAYLGFG
jgi:hypothetical protein